MWRNTQGEKAYVRKKKMRGAIGEFSLPTFSPS